MQGLKTLEAFFKPLVPQAQRSLPSSSAPTLPEPVIAAEDSKASNKDRKEADVARDTAPLCQPAARAPPLVELNVGTQTLPLQPSTRTKPALLPGNGSVPARRLKQGGMPVPLRATNSKHQGSISAMARGMLADTRNLAEAETGAADIGGFDTRTHTLPPKASKPSNGHADLPRHFASAASTQAAPDILQLLLRGSSGALVDPAGQQAKRARLDLTSTSPHEGTPPDTDSPCGTVAMTAAAAATGPTRPTIQPMNRLQHHAVHGQGLGMGMGMGIGAVELGFGSYGALQRKPQIVQVRGLWLQCEACDLGLITHSILHWMDK